MTDKQTPRTTRAGQPIRPLAEWRHVRGMSQEALARRTELSADTIGNIESNRNLPNVATALRLADALDVDLGQIAWPTPDQLTPPPSKRDRAKKEAA
jgi:transcriptional regulator with XRE-family HTH domain